MTFDKEGRTSRFDPLWSRRRFLTAASVATVGTVAGCSGVTSHEFEAEPVGLREDARTDLSVAQTAGDSTTTTRTFEAVDGEVTITSYMAAYARGPARGRPTLVERFLGDVNDTEGAGSAVVVPGSAMDAAGVGYFDDVDWLSGAVQRMSLVVPASVRAEGNGGKGPLATEDGGETTQPIPSSVMALGAGRSGDLEPPSTDEMAEHMDYPWLARAADVFPRRGWHAPEDATWAVGERWYPGGGTEYAGIGPETPVLVLLGDRSPVDVFGVSAEEMPGERLGGEGTRDTGNNPFLQDTGNNPFLQDTGNNPFLVAAPDSVAVGGQSPFTIEDLFAAGVPAPLGGATYGIGVLSTPTAEVAGQVLNPVANMGVEELLATEQARTLLKQAGVTDAENVEWLHGPTPVSDVPDGTEFLADVPDGTEFVADSPDGTTIVDQETDLETFVGVVSGTDGPWLVGVHAVRVDHEDDVVVAAGVHRIPWPSADYVRSNESIAKDGKQFTGILGTILSEARGLTAATDERFDTGDADII